MITSAGPISLGRLLPLSYDGMGKLIYGPRKAANSKHGPHYKFVSFMEIFTNTIDGPDGPHSS